MTGKLLQTGVTRAWKMLGVDLTGPFPRSTSGNVYLIAFVDYYIRWVEFYPLRKATAETVSQVLTQEILTRWGVPILYLSDQGSQFVSAVFKANCAIWNLCQKWTSAYRPRTKLFERINKFWKQWLWTIIISTGIGTWLISASSWTVLYMTPPASFPQSLTYIEGPPPRALGRAALAPDDSPHPLPRLTRIYQGHRAHWPPGVHPGPASQGTNASEKELW